MGGQPLLFYQNIFTCKSPFLGSCRKVVDAKRRRRDIINNRMWSEAELTDIHDITLASHAMAALSKELVQIISPHARLLAEQNHDRKFRFATLTVTHNVATAWLFPLHNFSA